MVYNLTGIAGNSTGLLTFTQGVNSNLMGGMLGNLILIGIFAVLIIAFLYTTQDIKKAAASASFISFTLALSLKALELVSNLAIFVTLILCAMSLFFIWKP